ncbi:MAG: hypothetical protein P4M00_01285 [Azospirillaceae bacterium]|nr:hypothetical protein [Azospirillaceae bacterium]
MLIPREHFWSVRENRRQAGVLVADSGPLEAGVRTLLKLLPWFGGCAQEMLSGTAGRLSLYAVVLREGRLWHPGAVVAQRRPRDVMVGVKWRAIDGDRKLRIHLKMRRYIIKYRGAAAWHRKTLLLVARRAAQKGSWDFSHLFKVR